VFFRALLQTTTGIKALLASPHLARKMLSIITDKSRPDLLYKHGLKLIIALSKIKASILTSFVA
jgi:hypothetical protein